MPRNAVTAEFDARFGSGHPLATFFGVSPRAMAIRLEELELVAGHLYAGQVGKASVTS